MAPIFVDDGAAARDVDVEVDRDDVARAESPTHRDRNGIDERAIEEPAAVDLDGAEDAGKRIGRADGLDEISARQPHFMPGADLGGDGREPPVEILDSAVAEMLLEALAETLSGDETGAGQIEVEIAEYAPARQLASEVLDFIEMSGDIAAADDRADGRTGDDVGLYAGSEQSPQDADVRPAASGTAPQCQADLARTHDSLHSSGPPLYEVSTGATPVLQI